MDFSASAATKDAARLRRRRFCTPPRFFSTLPHRLNRSKQAGNWSRNEPPELQILLVAGPRNHFNHRHCSSAGAVFPWASANVAAAFPRRQFRRHSES
jgi:hypothetical protein